MNMPNTGDAVALIKGTNNVLSVSFSWIIITNGIQTILRDRQERRTDHRILRDFPGQAGHEPITPAVLPIVCQMHAPHPVVEKHAVIQIRPATAKIDKLLPFLQSVKHTKVIARPDCSGRGEPLRSL